MPKWPATLWTATAATAHGKLIATTLGSCRATAATMSTWAAALLPPQAMPDQSTTFGDVDVRLRSNPATPPLEPYRATLPPGQTSPDLAGASSTPLPAKQHSHSQLAPLLAVTSAQARTLAASDAEPVIIVFAAGKHTEGVFAGKHCPLIRRPPEKNFFYSLSRISS